MNRALISRICLFAGAFFPLHVVPPVLSDEKFGLTIGVQRLQQIGIAYHIGFALVALVILLLGGKASFWLVLRWRYIAVFSCFVGIASTYADPNVQVLSRLLLGGGAVVLLSAFYRNLKDGGSYEQLPFVFGASAIVLESGALLVGIVVEMMGYQTALHISCLLFFSTLMLAIALQNRAFEPINQEIKVRFDFSGSFVFIAVAILAYGGFFLMLLSLGTLGSLSYGATVSGYAIFSTAFTFSIGNLLPFERLSLFRKTPWLVLLGTSVSVIGSVAVWLGIRGGVSMCIIAGAATVAFGNGITVSRCFQKASLMSSDGFSGSILTMLGVMVFTVILTLGADSVGGVAPLMQIAAFVLAFATIVTFGGQHVLRDTHL